MEQIYVVKANGQREPFSENKILRSIRRAGIEKVMEREVLDHIKERLYQNIPTSDVYRHIIEFLGKAPSSKIRDRYSLKKAIMELGPTGFPFEKLIARIFEKKGFNTQIDQIIHGRCVSHEADVVLEKEGYGRILIECKFHNTPGTRTNVRTPLYVHSRFEDIKAERDGSLWKEAWIVTNTKCTEDAIAFALCSRMRVISWGYPAEGNLQDLLENNGLYPLTCLNSLENFRKKILLEEGLVTCLDIINKEDFVKRLFAKDLSQGEKVIKEAKDIVDSHTVGK